MQLICIQNITKEYIHQKRISYETHKKYKNTEET